MKKKLKFVTEVDTRLMGPFKTKESEAMASSVGMQKAFSVQARMFAMTYGNRRTLASVGPAFEAERKEWSSHLVRFTHEGRQLEENLRNATVVSIKIKPFSAESIQVQMCFRRNRQVLGTTGLILYCDDGRLGPTWSTTNIASF